MELINRNSNVALVAEIFSLEDNMFRIKINEKSPIKERYEVVGALVGEPRTRKYVVFCISIYNGLID